MNKPTEIEIVLKTGIFWEIPKDKKLVEGYRVWEVLLNKESMGWHTDPALALFWALNGVK